MLRAARQGEAGRCRPAQPHEQLGCLTPHAGCPEDRERHPDRQTLGGPRSTSLPSCTTSRSRKQLEELLHLRVAVAVGADQAPPAAMARDQSVRAQRSIGGRDHGGRLSAYPRPVTRESPEQKSRREANGIRLVELHVKVTQPRAVPAAPSRSRPGVAPHPAPAGRSRGARSPASSR
jgi:hypothetical protein